jgi:DNA-binding MarR family transcriptional regulator
MGAGSGAAALPARHPFELQHDPQRSRHLGYTRSCLGGALEHLLNSGFVEERTVDTRRALVVVTATGRRALRTRS